MSASRTLILYSSQRWQHAVEIRIWIAGSEDELNDESEWLLGMSLLLFVYQHQ
jgi:hypothetical protein